MPSFDIVCEVETHEIRNAVDQANREVVTRYDFKGVDASFELKENDITMKAEVDFQLQQMLDILKQKMTKRDANLLDIDVSEGQLLKVLEGHINPKKVIKKLRNLKEKFGDKNAKRLSRK